MSTIAEESVPSTFATVSVPSDQTTLTGEQEAAKVSSQANSFSDESVVKGPPGVDMSTILTGKKLAVVFSAMVSLSVSHQTHTFMSFFVEPSIVY